MFKRFLINCETIILGTGLAIVICLLLFMFGNGEDLKLKESEIETLNNTARILNMNTVILNSIKR